jgi:hypothetical protein
MRLASILAHLFVFLVAGGVLWWLTAAFPVRARLAFLAALALGMIHARLRKWVSSSETARPSRR